MKKIMLSLGALSLAFGAPMAVPTAASAEANPWVAHCKSIIEFYPEHSLGECIAFFTSDPQAAATKYCLYASREGWLDGLGFKNMGECVKTLGG